VVRDIPTRSRLVVHPRHRARDPRIGERVEPADAALAGDARAQREHEHRVRAVVRDQRSTRLRVAQLIQHALDRAAHHALLGIGLDVDETRQHVEQQLGIALEREVAAEDEHVVARREHANAVGRQMGEQHAGIFRARAEIAAQLEPAAVRQHQAVARRELHRLLHAVDHAPTRAFGDDVTLDAFVRLELKRPSATAAQRARVVAANFDERQHVRQRIHGSPYDCDEITDEFAWRIRSARPMVNACRSGRFAFIAMASPPTCCNWITSSRRNLQPIAFASSFTRVASTPPIGRCAAACSRKLYRAASGSTSPESSTRSALASPMSRSAIA
jgi:hypothetical protein